jgi:uncharacterized protein YjbJ (UPF0337 family)
MGDRIDEAVGDTKKVVGDLTGNEGMEEEGKAQADRAKFERETEGAVDKTIGKVQETWGDITDDESTEAEGKARQMEGSVKQAG